MIIGLDISTTCLAICILEDSGELRKLDHLDLSDEKNFFEMARKFEKFIDKIIFPCSENILGIFIEEAKKGFANQKTTNNTILLLNRFNAVCAYIIGKSLSCEPIFLNETTARKRCGLKIISKKKSGGVSQKEQTFEQMKTAKVFENYKWQLKRTGRVKDFEMDRVDAYVVARAGYLIHF